MHWRTSERPSLACFTLLVALAPACGRSSMVDLPLWRAEPDASGREVRLVQLPFEQISFDMKTNEVVRRVVDRDQDGTADRIIVYDGIGGARTEETDTDFNGSVDRWDSFGSDGQRLRSATATMGDRPDRMATYDRDGQLARVEIDSDLDGRVDLVHVYEAGRLAENRLDSDGNGRTDRVQDVRKGYMASEAFDTDEDGLPNLIMTYGPDGRFLRASVQARAQFREARP